MYTAGEAPEEAADGIIESNPNIAIVNPTSEDLGGPTTPAARESRRHVPRDLASERKPHDVLSKYSKKGNYKASCHAFPTPAVMLQTAAPPTLLRSNLNSERMAAQNPSFQIIYTCPECQYVTNDCFLSIGGIKG